MGELLTKVGRHNMRPNHLHLMIEAPGYHKLTTALFLEGDKWLSSDAVFGIKKSLVVVSLRKFQSLWAKMTKYWGLRSRNISMWMMMLKRKDEDSPGEDLSNT